MTAEIWHGDSVELVGWLPDGEVDCVLTDPPYGVNYRSRRPITPEGKKWVKDVANDKDLAGAIELFLDVMIPMLEDKLAPEADVYIFTRWDVVDTWIDLVRHELEPLGLAYKMMLVWEKGYPGQGDIDANWGCGHELILYCKRGRADVNFRRSGVIHVDKVAPAKQVHPTEKPIELMEILLSVTAERGDLVVDPFSGSGAAVIAARNRGCRAIGIEKDPAHVKLSKDRLGQLSLFG